MNCLRCGYCCKNYLVVIVVDPNKGICEDNLTAHNGDGQACRHLQGDAPGQYSCALHQKSWYIETPCHHHKQIEQRNTNCRLGEYVLEKFKSRMKKVAI